MATNRLTVRNVETIKPGNSLPDGQGLSVVCHDSGIKSWVIRFREHGKLKRLSLGKFPAVSLAQAREKRDAILKQLGAGLMPTRERKRAKINARMTFKEVADEMLGTMRANSAVDGKPSEATITKTEWLVDMAGKAFGTTPIGEISPDMVLTACKKIEISGRRETARRMLSAIGRVMRIAASRGLAQGDPAKLLYDQLAKPKSRHYAAIVDETELGNLLRDVWGYTGLVVRSCLQTHIYLAMRPGETRAMKWSELDLARAEWHLPSSRVKIRTGRVIPLPKQVVTIINTLQPITGEDEYVFASTRPHRCMSETTMNSTLRTIGYSAERVSPHGFRTTFKTVCENHNKERLIIELCLGHSTQSTVAEGYDASDKRIKERAKLLQWYANHLDKLRFLDS